MAEKCNKCLSLLYSDKDERAAAAWAERGTQAGGLGPWEENNAPGYNGWKQSLDVVSPFPEAGT